MNNLCKAKSLETNEWVIGYFLKTQECTYVMRNNQFNDDLFLGTKNIIVEIDRNTLCRCVGKIDANQKYIFENDIIRSTGDIKDNILVFWDEENCSFSLKYLSDGEYFGFETICEEFFEVIGNTFDNPELLGKKISEKDNWISCNDRFPTKNEYLKNDGRFIVTDGNRVYESCYDIYNNNWKTVKFTDVISGEYGLEIDKCVIKWQPLPDVPRN